MEENPKSHEGVDIVAIRSFKEIVELTGLTCNKYLFFWGTICLLQEGDPSM